MATRIYECRKSEGISQEELGALLGVSRQAVSKWESGQTMPDLDNMEKLCGVLGTSADYLISGRGDYVGNTAQKRRNPMRMGIGVSLLWAALGGFILLGLFTFILSGVITPKVGGSSVWIIAGLFVVLGAMGITGAAVLIYNFVKRKKEGGD